MSRKHFQALADAVKRAADRIETLDVGRSDSRIIREIIADEMALTLLTENPRFDRSRFLDACGVKQS